MRRRVRVEADHVPQLGDELGVPGRLERPHAVRDEPLRLPDALHGAEADTGGPRHRAAGDPD